MAIGQERSYICVQKCTRISGDGSIGRIGIFCVRIDCRVPARYSDRSASIPLLMGAVAKLPLSCCLPRQTNGRFEVKGAGFCPKAITQRKLLTLLSSSLHTESYSFPAMLCTRLCGTHLNPTLRRVRTKVQSLT